MPMPWHVAAIRMREDEPSWINSYTGNGLDRDSKGDIYLVKWHYKQISYKLISYKLISYKPISYKLINHKLVKL